MLSTVIAKVTNGKERLILEMKPILIHSSVKIDHQKLQLKTLRLTWKLVKSAFLFVQNLKKNVKMLRDRRI